MRKSNAHPYATQAAWLTRYLDALKSLEPATYHFSPNDLLETFKTIAITKHQQGEKFKCDFLNVSVEILGKPRILIWEQQKKKIRHITKQSSKSTRNTNTCENSITFLSSNRSNTALRRIPPFLVPHPHPLPPKNHHAATQFHLEQMGRWDLWILHHYWGTNEQDLRGVMSDCLFQALSWSGRAKLRRARERIERRPGYTSTQREV